MKSTDSTDRIVDPTRFAVCIECVDQNTDTLGNFLTRMGTTAGTHRAESPVFPNLADLFLWMKVEGWTERRLPSGQWEAIPPARSEA